MYEKIIVNSPAYKIFFLEAGINHFGKLDEANKIISFFIKSKFQNLTFMIHTQKFYNDQKKKGIDFQLHKNFYEKIINKIHSKKKKIGLAICDDKTFEDLKHLKFDFYKLLGAGIKNLKLIRMLNLTKKPVYISTSFSASKKNIKKCISLFNNQSRLTLLHSPMTYSPREVNLSNIITMKREYHLKVGYSNHYNDANGIFLSSAYKPDAIFLYCKPKKKKEEYIPMTDMHFILMSCTK